MAQRPCIRTNGFPALAVFFGWVVIDTKREMTDEAYQGWKNYETWLVALWLDNEASSYRYWRDAAGWHRVTAAETVQVRQCRWTSKEATRFNLADQLKQEVGDSKPLTVPSMYSDLLDAALSAVDWHEIARNILEED